MSTVSHCEALDMARPLPAPGRYRHFKGGEYELLRVGQHTESEELLVIYCAVDDPETIWVRPLEMFTDVVEEHDVPRFQRCDTDDGSSIAMRVRTAAIAVALRGRRAISDVASTRHGGRRARRVSGPTATAAWSDEA